MAEEEGGVVNVLDLFSGIGGFSLGLERAGMRTVAFCEVKSFRCGVLGRHWPAVRCFPDVRSVDVESLASVEAIDVIAGGFPCQDISLLGNGSGLDGARSGLWAEFWRLIGLIRPRYVIIENVPALRGRGLGAMLRQLASLRYDAEWHCIPAASVGAPHLRDRLWIVAYPARLGRGEILIHVPPAKSFWPQDRLSSGCFEDLVRQRVGQSGVRGVVYGVPDRVDRVAALGDTVVPQLPEFIGRAIMQAEGSQS
jgi:DNA (cytosine-5)-methyltransferase 1